MIFLSLLFLPFQNITMYCYINRNMLSVIITSATYSICRITAHCAKYNFAECHYADCRGSLFECCKNVKNGYHVAAA
jgi:hypothetical protein